MPQTLRSAAPYLLLLALIIIPFLVFGAQLEAWSERRVAGVGAVWYVGLLVVGLLAADVVLPVPSSMLSTTAGVLMGFWGGLAASFVGMSFGCVVGYALGRAGGSPQTGVVDLQHAERLEELTGRFGSWALAVCRPVPVLAEASVVIAGAGRMAIPRFLSITCLSNLGISAVYAFVGATAASTGTFLLAFVASAIAPGLALLLVRTLRSPAGDTGSKRRI